MNISPLLACGPDGSILVLAVAVVGGGGLLCLGSFVTGVICLCGSHKTLGLWLVFIPIMIVGALLGWLSLM